MCIMNNILLRMHAESYITCWTSPRNFHTFGNAQLLYFCQFTTLAGIPQKSFLQLLYNNEITLTKGANASGEFQPAAMHA